MNREEISIMLLNQLGLNGRFHYPLAIDTNHHYHQISFPPASSSCCSSSTHSLESDWQSQSGLSNGAFTQLPAEIWELIFGWVPYKDLCMLSCVCKSFWHATMSQVLWKRLAQRELSQLTTEIERYHLQYPEKHWKFVYMHFLRKARRWPPPFPRAKTLYSYLAQTSDELTITEGDILQVLEEDPSGWWMAKSARTGLKGYIPSNYVERMDPGDAGKVEEISEGKAIALYDYSRDCARTFTLRNSPELTFKKDEVIELFRVQTTDTWYRGKIRFGTKEGWVHPSYLIVLPASNTVQVKPN
jgi:hypothetical protein